MFLPAPVPAKGTGGAALPGALTEPRPRRAHCDSARPRPRRAPSRQRSLRRRASQSARAPLPALARYCPVVPAWDRPLAAARARDAVGPAPLFTTVARLELGEGWPRPFPSSTASHWLRGTPRPCCHWRRGGAATLKRGCGRVAGLEAVRARLVLAELLAPFPSFKHHEGSERAIYPQIPHEGLRTLRMPRSRGRCLAVRDEERGRSCRRGAEGSLGTPCLVYTSPRSKCRETLLNLKSLIPHLSLQRVTR